MGEIAEQGLDLDSFVAQVKDDAFIPFAARRTGLSESEVREVVDIYANEIPVGMALIDGIPLDGKRILEVGAGIGALSIFLKRSGVEIVALEPGKGGFDRNLAINTALAEWTGTRELERFDIGAEKLDPAKHGTFDLIFSVNVLEHIPDLEASFGAMARVLAPNGFMVHGCPNYVVPYEPHFGIPLVPFAPKLTAYLKPSLKTSPVWNSLNFVTIFRISRLARDNGLDVTFERKQLYNSFERFSTDPAFRDRHKGLVSHVHRVLVASRLIEALKLLPNWASTPMKFTCWRK